MNQFYVALYIRVSTYEQAEFGYSLQAQLEALQENCRANQWTVFEAYVDEGISGKRADNRPALQRLLTDAEQGRFQLVLVWKINRLSRTALDLLETVEHLKRHNVSLRSLTEPFETQTPMGQFTLQMMSAVGELERKTISENMSLGRQRRNQLGKYCGSRILGYHAETTEYHSARHQTTTLTIIPQEAALVQHIFTLYAEGLGYKAIMNRINQSGYSTKAGKAYSINTIRSILNNAVYTGRVRYYDPEEQIEKIVQGEHEAIISLPLWEKVQLRLQEISGRPKKHIGHEFILASLLRCPNCSSGMVGGYTTATRKSGDTKRYCYYVCSRYHNKGNAACKPNHIQAHAVEDEVLNYLKYLITRPRLLRDVVDRVNHQARLRLQSLNEQLQQLERQLKDGANQRKHLFELFEQDLISQQDLAWQLGNIKQYATDTEKEKIRLKQEQAIELRKEVSFPHIQEALEQFDLLWQPSSINKKRKLLRNMIEKVTIRADKSVQIHLNEALLDISLLLDGSAQHVS
ncbi:hypothetical protein BSK63_23675 [Paenibacillus odorifer]|uniref:recombinase family protein n=1 Tax=Paenibacillus odorifer TaxID=189426 RepID=UPI00096F4948|nr:recombinase family protein [Paenibacillus odorifer]OME28913.1 hypothetical protein BSK63_23675 [Paenibacillus odorifer]